MIPRQGMATSTSAIREIQVRAADGLMLRGRWWHRAEPRGGLVIAHGFGEHGGTYRHVAESLGAALDIDVIAVDLRGHGASPGRRGMVRRYDELTDDLACAMEWVAQRMPDLPRFLLGHSNGGQVALRFALEDRSPIQGLIISNPALRIALPIPPHKIRLGKLLLQVRALDYLEERVPGRLADPRPGHAATAPQRSLAAQPHQRPALLRHARRRRDVARTRRRVANTHPDDRGRAGSRGGPRGGPRVLRPARQRG